MKVIIAGSRTIDDYAAVCRAVERSGFKPTEIVSGGARGVDRLGERWAKEHGVPVKKFTAHWDKYGKSAGYRRNEEMADYANALVAVWDGKSRGTSHMVELAGSNDLPTHIYTLHD